MGYAAVLSSCRATAVFPCRLFWVGIAFGERYRAVFVRLGRPLHPRLTEHSAPRPIPDGTTSMPSSKTRWASCPVCSPGRVREPRLTSEARLSDEQLVDDVCFFQRAKYLSTVDRNQLPRAARGAKNVRNYDEVARAVDRDADQDLPIQRSDSFPASACAMGTLVGRSVLRAGIMAVLVFRKDCPPILVVILVTGPRSPSLPPHTRRALVGPFVS